VTGCEEDTTSCLAFPDQMTGGRRAHDTVLSKQQLLDTVGSTDLCDQLHDLGVPVAPISSDNKVAVLDTFWDGKKNAGDECLGVVILLEDLDLLAKPRAVVRGMLAYSRCLRTD